MRRLIVLLACAASAFGATTTAWELHSYNDFIKGRFSGLALTRDGRVQLAPEARTLLASEQPSIWSVAQGAGGELYLGTGHKGRVLSLSKDGKATTIFSAMEPEIFAVAYGPDKAVYAGTSPNGKVYKITNGKAVEFFSPREQYIWSLAFAPDGSLFVGTGNTGKIYRVGPNGQGEVYYETGQAHITALAIDLKGQLLAGSEPNGILYRIFAKDKAFVLYDSSLPEIRSLVVAPDGAIYAAALGGSVARRANAASSSTSPVATPLSTPTTTITVTDVAPTQAGVDIKATAEAQKPATPQVAVPVAPAVEMGGIEKSALYRIQPDNRVETLWTSKEENAYDVLLSADGVILATDTQGRIYRLGPDRKPSLLAQTNEGETTRLLKTPDGVLVATGSTGKLLELISAPVATGSYESPVHDATGVARWGALSWRGSDLGGSKIVFRTRTGNSARPDKTWSDWSAPVTSRNSQVSSPNARFIQWKAELRGNGAQGPSLDSVVISYLPQNNPPVIRSFNVTTFTTGSTTPKASTPPAASTPGTYSVTVTDGGDAGAASSTGTPSQTFGRSVSQQAFLNWQADDPDSDRLLYSLYYRGEDEQTWKLLRGNFADQSFTVDSDIFADGRYLFKLVASDKAVNSAPTALEVDAVSVPIIFDNTPPIVKAMLGRRQDGAATIQGEARDASSSIRRAEYSLDAGTWTPLDPVDGILDSLEERFTLNLEKLTPGEHVVVFRVSDAAGNSGLTKLVIH